MAASRFAGPAVVAGGAVEAPVELIIVRPGWSRGGAGVIIGTVIGLAAVTDCCGGGAVVGPAGRIIGDDDAGVIVRDVGLTMDPAVSSILTGVAAHRRSA